MVGECQKQEHAVLQLADYVEETYYKKQRTGTIYGGVGRIQMACICSGRLVRCIKWPRKYIPYRVT